MKTLRFLLVAGIVSLLLPSGPGAAQGVLLDARVQMALPLPGEAAQIQITYRILPGSGAKEVPLSVLAPEPIRIDSLRAFLGGQELDFSREVGPGFHLESVRDHYSEGSVRIPETFDGGPDTLSLRFSYAVEGEWGEGGRATLPLVIPRWVPDQPTPRTFLARVEVPQGLTIIGSFPTSVLNRPPPGRGGTYEMGLQAVPAMLVLRVVQGKVSPITMERGLDIFVLLILLVMGAFGVRYLRGREG
jgi:hypothetical protein